MSGARNSYISILLRRQNCLRQLTFSKLLLTTGLRCCFCAYAGFNKNTNKNNSVKSLGNNVATELLSLPYEAQITTSCVRQNLFLKAPVFSNAKVLLCAQKGIPKGYNGRAVCKRNLFPVGHRGGLGP